MKTFDKVVFSVVVVLLIGLVGLHFLGQDLVISEQPTASATGALVTGAVVGGDATFASTAELSLATAVNCFSYSTSNTCLAGNCSWDTHDQGSFCRDFNCYDGDSTNQTYCETVNVTLGLPYSCEWQNGSGQEECEPLGGDFFGNGCSDFLTETACYDTFFCFWNETGTNCEEPIGGFTDDNIFQGSPSCGILLNNETCVEVTGCSWNATTSACSGNSAGVQCGDLSESLCPSATFLPSCCNWNGTGCGFSLSQECYSNTPDLPTGAEYCEDVNAYNNETVCNLLATDPWYMPCVWDNSSTECHYNNDVFGGADQGGFHDIESQSACEAQNGQWITEQYIEGGVTKTDTWCEFKFGAEFGGGNCDSACWACENDPTVVSSLTAESVCEGSALGYCEFRADGNALNGYGWCFPKDDFISGGGKNCKDECSACDFLNSPEESCTSSPASCVWNNDSEASNGVGNCYGASEKYCGTDCWSCYTESDCSSNGNGGNGACSWDATNGYCKETGFTGEVCFDGLDNDNDGNVDCADSGCATDKFCGGASLGDALGVDCPFLSQQGNETCINSGCIWLSNNFDEQFGGEGAGFCEFPGMQCFQHDGEAANCNAEAGCSYLTTEGGFCDENSSTFDTCFPLFNSTACDAQAGLCTWITDAFNPSGGRCEPTIFGECLANTTRHSSQTACEENVTVSGLSTQICAWDTFGSGEGMCNPVCFSQTNETCGNFNGLCEVVTGICEPDSFGGNCFSADGNQTMCNTDLNSSCTYFVNQNAENNVSGTEPSGYCDPKGDVGFKNFVGNIEPEPLIVDGGQAGIDDAWDINEVSLREDFDNLGLVTFVEDFTEAGICNNVFVDAGLGTGEQNHTFFWYLDTNGVDSDNCAVRDNASITGFEFSFKYQGEYGTSLTETKVSYRCVNGSWAPAPIPLISQQQMMCNFQGGMIGIDKSEMFKFKGLFNKSADLRLYATVGNISNDSIAEDAAGPGYYSPGAVDFKFEECANPGADADGDGITASNDPDCFDFLKFGYVPNEIGFQCTDGIDNDADGMTDCSDLACSHSFECGGTGIPVEDADDNSAPKVVWLEVNTFPDSAFIMYDTNEPSNGTLSFYHNDSTCGTLNSTIRDVGVYDSFVPDYKVWHDSPIDNFAFNPEALDYTLSNATAYYFKTRVCDVNNNCAVSACLNFTTKTTFDDCKSCTSTLKFPFQPAPGAVATDPAGNLNFTIFTPDGDEVLLGANSQTGSQLNYTQTKNFDFLIENKDSDESNWSFKMINASIVGKISSSILTFNQTDDDLGYNNTANGTFVGLGNTKCQELVNTFRPKKLHISIPGNNSNLYQCDASLGNCTQKNIGTNATNFGFNVTTNTTLWEVPAEWGC
ncbi:hypothetical protein HOI26_05920 [Candidatus Woesearchaeota archaeon]|jgi:hypothetical protein|nr:hypothetical protein [Candidatus Woesearchaeota archaeon]MBT4935994.1 hypothetical protein [Candidatus Woesearchaeota archaeon]MBT5740605.1 hypothetical protein [Candidatus Woesearchaeota archaeon]